MDNWLEGWAQTVARKRAKLAQLFKPIAHFEFKRESPKIIKIRDVQVSVIQNDDDRKKLAHGVKMDSWKDWLKNTIKMTGYNVRFITIKTNLSQNERMNKTTDKKIKMVFTRWAYHFFSRIFGILPLKFIFFIGDGLIYSAFLSVKRMRKIAQESLTIAFGKEKSEDEIKQLLRASFFNLFRGALETLCYAQRPELILKKVRLASGSRENLEQALNENKGVLAVSAHFGNFPLMLLCLSKLGYPLHAIIRPSPDKTIERSFQQRREQLGLKTILSYPRKTCVQQALKALRAKEIVAILMDQHTGSKSGVFVDFFGQQARTPTGAVVFAMRTGSPILPVFTLRDGKDSHKIIIEPHFYLENKATDDETLQHNVQKITDIIESYIRRYPTEWVWMHRRWKSRPSERSAYGGSSH